MSFPAEARQALAVRCIGSAAYAALSGGAGVVCAVFRRSFYLRCAGERYACVGESGLGRGPLNAIVGRLALPREGERVALAVGGAALWRAPDLPPAAVQELPGRLSELAARASPPAEGLGARIAGGSTPLIAYAQEPLCALDRWLVSGGSVPDAAAALIGLGPGLTPSGDDYLGGVLIALRSLGRGADADALWRWLQPRLPQATTAISAAHLAAAAAGEGHEALHEGLVPLLHPQRPEWGDRLARLGAVGHCSGWDALAGAVAALSAAAGR